MKIFNRGHLLFPSFASVKSISDNLIRAGREIRGQNSPKPSSFMSAVLPLWLKFSFHRREEQAELTFQEMPDYATPNDIFTALPPIALAA